MEDLANEQPPRLDLLESLLLDENAIGDATVFKITVLQSMVNCEKTKFTNRQDFKDAVLGELIEINPFSPRQRRNLNEGFIQFDINEDSCDFYYVREVPFRWEFVHPESEKIQSVNIKRVDSAYRVRVNVLFQENNVIMSFFGGTESLVNRAREIVGNAIKRQTVDFIKKDVKFSRKQMQNILTRFGKNVALINIDPRDNEKFSKIVESRAIGETEVKKTVLYNVFNFRMSGVKIVNSPEVSRLIKEKKIRLTEISGSLWLDGDAKVSCRVKSNGRVVFNISSKYYGTNLDAIYDKAVELYTNLVSKEDGFEKGPLERFF